MEVSKILRIESPVFLWNILKHREEIFESRNDLIYFLDCFEVYANGCLCDEEVNYDNMIDSYTALDNDEFKSYLAKSFECNEVRFLK
jgi:hypothetical protein